MTSISRRITRGVACLGSGTLGFIYAIPLPHTMPETQVVYPLWPVRAWGICLLVGGVCGLAALASRVMVIERIGLTFVITGLAALLFAQLLVTISGGIATSEVAGVALVVMIMAYLIDRWLAVRRAEQDARTAMIISQEMNLED